MDLEKNIGIQEKLIKKAHQTVGETRALLAKQEAAAQAIDIGSRVFLIVRLFHHYDDMGGVNIEHRSEGELEEAFREAIEKYEEANSYEKALGDVGAISVCAEVAGIEFPLAKEDFMPVYRRLSDREKLRR
jgi:hypothetical protein